MPLFKIIEVFCHVQVNGLKERLASDLECVCNINQPILQKGVQYPHPHKTERPQL